MKSGDPLDCPFCGKSTFVVKEALMDGWTKKGDVLKCVTCGAVIESCQEKKEEASPAPDGNHEKRNALAALLGDDSAETAQKNDAFMKEECTFCRDCRFRVINAFRIYCTKHDKDVNPMDDCPDFQKREEPKEK